MSTVTINGLPTYPGSVDGVNDLIPIFDYSGTSANSVSRNNFLNIASQPVGLSDFQTLTNKTLTSPTVSSPTFSGTLAGTYTIGGTPTFPSSVVQLSATQTLTSKTLTSPTITSPTITNATISADTVTGYTTSNSGTIYGVPIVTGSLSATYLTAASITNTQVSSGGLYTSKVYNPYKFYFYAGTTTLLTNGTWTIVNFNTKNYDTGTNYSTGTNLFTAPIAGFYVFSANAQVTAGGTETYDIAIYKNNSIYAEGNKVYGQAGTLNMTISPPPIQLNANDTISVYVYNGSGGTKTVSASGTATYFGGYLVSAT